MTSNTITGTNLVWFTPYCPKPNHIKPCWCGGKARCAGVTRTGERCGRIVRGFALFCFQHPVEAEDIG